MKVLSEYTTFISYYIFIFFWLSTLCLKKTSPMFLAITRESIVGFS